MENRRLSILISAYACEPHKGSEPAVGWNWVKQIARFANTWVITRANNKQVIEDELRNNPDVNLHFIYVDLPKWARFWKKGGRGIRTYYYLWQFAAIKKALQYKRKQSFDLAHHITFVNDWLPCLLVLLPLPFIWGPIGSHPNVPLRFMPNNKALSLEIFRRIIQNFFRCFDPFFYLTLFLSKKIIHINKEMKKKYPFFLIAESKYYYQPAIGYDVISEIVNQKKKDIECLKIISVGRLIYFKGFHLALKAFSKVLEDNYKMKFEIVGEGTELHSLEKFTRKLGIKEQVLFTGNVPRTEVIRKMSKSDIFLFPSFEGGGMVVLEAMAARLPIVCLDYGGPGKMVSDECGIKVKPKNPGQTVQELSEGLIKLASDPELRKRMGAASRKRVEEYFSWENKGEFIQKLYLDVLDSEGSSRT